MEIEMKFYGGNPNTYLYAGTYQQERMRTTIVVPHAVGDLVLDKLRRHFIDSAGGCTETFGRGWWHAFTGGQYTSEPVSIFAVAGLPLVAVKAAAEMVLEAGQTDVYVELASGQCVWFNRKSETLEPAA